MDRKQGPASGLAATAADKTQPADGPALEKRARSHAIRMTAIGFASFNIGIGSCYGTFGALVLELERMFQADRTVMGLVLAIVALMHGLMAPVIGYIVPRTGIRRMMIFGAVLTSLGFAALAVAQGSFALLAIYGLLIGPGTALMGVLPVMTLISNWYDRGQGKMIGIALMPLLVTVTPILTVWLLPVLGVKGILLGLAAITALLIPFQITVVDRPEQLGLEPVGADKSSGGGSQNVLPTITVRGLLRSPVLFAMATGAGIVAGAGIAKSSHLVPILVEQGWSLETSALLLSVSGATGILGSILFGAAADRWKAATTLAMGAFLQMVVWWILIIPAGFGLLLIDAVIFGICGGGLISAKAVLVRRIFGRENFAFVSGFSSLISIPFMFLISPTAGYLRDTTGSYLVPLVTIIALLAAAGLINLAIIRTEKRSLALPA